MRLFSLIFLLGLFSSCAHAHQVLTSNVFFDFGDAGIKVEMQIPLDQLSIAAPDLADKTHISLSDANRAAIINYLSQHTSLQSGDQQTLAMQVTDLQQSDIYGRPFLIARLLFSAIPGNNDKSLILHDDIILHQVVTHKIYVSVRSDFNHAVFPNNPELLGVLRYKHKELTINRSEGGLWQGFQAILLIGMHHIAEGNDHLLFLLCLLLPAPLLLKGYRWSTAAPVKTSLKNILQIVTAFTLGHSITLALASLNIVQVPSRPIEILVAVSILVSAIHAIKPIFGPHAMIIAAGFGLIHGLAFASEMAGRGFTGIELVLSLLGFNVGIEIMQLLIVTLLMPWLFMISRSRWYSLVRVGGAGISILVSMAWIGQRSWNADIPVDHWIQGLRNQGLWVYLSLITIACISLASARFSRSPDLNNTL